MPPSGPSGLAFWTCKLPVPTGAAALHATQLRLKGSPKSVQPSSVQRSQHPAAKTGQISCIHNQNINTHPLISPRQRLICRSPGFDSSQLFSQTIAPDFSPTTPILINLCTYRTHNGFRGMSLPDPLLNPPPSFLHQPPPPVAVAVAVAMMSPVALMCWQSPLPCYGSLCMDSCGLQVGGTVVRNMETAAIGLLLNERP